MRSWTWMAQEAADMYRPGEDEKGEAATASITEEAGRSALHCAAVSGDTAAARQLLGAADCAVERRDDAGSTPLHLAARHGRVDMVRLLAAHGGNVDSQEQCCLT